MESRAFDIRYHIGLQITTSRTKPTGSPAMFRQLTLILLAACSFGGAVCSQDNTIPSELRWWKGNLHTHSLWSDGDQFPEMIGDWYRQQGYNFLALTDHNTLSEGMRWMRVKDVVARSDDGILQRYRDRFGDDWVEMQGEPDDPASYKVRLKPLDEFRGLLEERNQFIMIPAEEISDEAEGKPVHINATNINEAIQPARGKTVREAMQNNLRAILEHEKYHGRQVLPHINHPNFGYAITAQDLAAVTSEKFFEVYNGHPGVNQLGDDTHPSIERMWDMANAIRRTDLNIAPLMGIATDDSHEYHGKPGSRPGRGWVMVRSRYLTPEHLIKAMKRGDFYASSGVTLKDVAFDKQAKRLTIDMHADGDEQFRTDFIATLVAGESDDDRIGKVVATVKGTHAEYSMSGNELYVRAIITSSKPHHDPSFKDQKQQAWTQPVGWEAE